MKYIGIKVHMTEAGYSKAIKCSQNCIHILLFDTQHIALSYT